MMNYNIDIHRASMDKANNRKSRSQSAHSKIAQLFIISLSAGSVILDILNKC